MRVHLAGVGEPIPLIALPDPNLDDASVPLLLEMEDGEIFVPADYIALGYTHYEIWCVGAAGGRGSDAGGRGFPVEEYAGQKPEAGPSGVAFSWPYTIVGGVTYVHYPQIGYIHSYGGGGGGGGMHRVAGPLSELPPAVPVTVGEAGPDRGAHQSADPAPIVPTIATTYEEAVGAKGKYGWPYFPGGVYDGGATPLQPQMDGVDGGHSSFGDICQASGGKGGKAAGKWIGVGDGALLWISGNGGEGGTGGRTEPGGGAAGSTSGADPIDGTWDGIIGKGGGGGRGGQPPSIRPSIQYAGP